MLAFKIAVTMTILLAAVAGLLMTSEKYILVMVAAVIAMNLSMVAMFLALIWMVLP